MENNFIYLDNASTTPLSENVLNIINSTYRNYWHNPSSTYELGIKCSTYLEKIRSKIAYIFEADPEDIIFTSGSSESTNIVFNNIYEKFKNGCVVISNVEHQASTICANKLRKQNWDIYEWTVNNDNIKVKVWERGAGPTLACGTGACAIHVAAYKLGLCNSQTIVTLPGGNLKIDWSKDDCEVMMTGNAKKVFSGSMLVNYGK